MANGNQVPQTNVLKVLGLIFLAGVFYATITVQVSTVKAQVEANALQNETDKRTSMQVEYHERKLRGVDQQLDRIEEGVGDLKEIVIRLEERESGRP